MTLEQVRICSQSPLVLLVADNVTLSTQERWNVDNQSQNQVVRSRPTVVAAAAAESDSRTDDTDANEEAEASSIATDFGADWLIDSASIGCRGFV